MPKHSGDFATRLYLLRMSVLKLKILLMLKSMASKYASEETEDSQCKDSFWLKSISNRHVSVNMNQISQFVLSLLESQVWESLRYLMH